MEIMMKENLFTNTGENSIVVGRAATGLYLLFVANNIMGQRVLVPANLCYAAIYPIQYAGGIPSFCDVDRYSGNVTYDTFVNACTEDTVAAIVPHMYGNPVLDLDKIALYCKANDILLVEDCASAMGAKSSYELGKTGDYTVYSTGYSKTIDLGIGGFVCSNRDLSPLLSLEKKLPEYNEQAEEELTLFSRIYRVLRNEDHGTLIGKKIYESIPKCCKDGFLYRISEEKKQWISNGVKNIDEVICKRWQKYNYYMQRLKPIENKIYNYSEGAVPWRFNLLLEERERRIVIKNCLEKQLPVSDWYPSVMPLFGYTEEAIDFPGIKWHEQHILNFPLLLDDSKIDIICHTILESLI